MIPVSLKKIANITNGYLYGKNIIINNISSNSKEIKSKTLFITLKGKKFDGYIFIQEAIKNGCTAIITDRKIKFCVSYIIVEDTLIALRKISFWLRKKINPKILAITGSCGKTSVKEMTVSIIKKYYDNTIYTINNFNNHIGVPITLLKLKKADKYGVIELGSNKPGEIKYNSKIVEPNIVLINNIYHSHLEGFKSLLGVSKEKSEILSYLKKNSIIIINLDSHHLSQWIKKIQNKKILYFSIEKKKKVIFSLLILNYLHTKHLLLCIHQMVK
ncbi:UDP-N-acetylmuramoyl-tripeptide--D-alanyl-D-alanine ligase [Buchnera aphidicola]|uniref:UDP-N-acetylmuramoyl-tripeptide--D-alanyl-D- alanine ligase n=1 Tax=Buchnera aphidicola TaxID=9 RepID=UPI003464642B